MAAKAGSVPSGVITLDQSMLASPYEPLAVDRQKTAGHLVQADVSSSRYLSSVFGQSPLQSGLKGFPSVNQPSAPIEGVHTRLWRSHLFCEWVGWACLEFFYELSGERLVEFKEEGVSVAHGTNLSLLIISPTGRNGLLWFLRGSPTATVPSPRLKPPEVFWPALRRLLPTYATSVGGNQPVRDAFAAMGALEHIPILFRSLHLSTTLG